MNFEELFHQAVLKYLHEKRGLVTAEKVIEVGQDEHYDYGGCDTCSYEYTVVTVVWLGADGAAHYEEIRTDMAEFMRELTA